MLERWNSTSSNVYHPISNHAIGCNSNVVVKKMLRFRLTASVPRLMASALLLKRVFYNSNGVGSLAWMLNIR